MKKHAVSYLKSLTAKQFAEFFYEIASTRDDGDFSDDQSHYILFDAYKYNTDDCQTSWEKQAIAEPIGSEQWDDKVPICQSGHCLKCDTAIRSWAKKARCPVCDAEVYCT